MATKHDYMLVKRFSEEAFEDFTNDMSINSDGFSDIQKARYGFYFLVLKNITGEENFNDLSKMIIDTDFLKKVFGESNNDLGVDAYYIDEKRGEIQLFNFKYRENWKPQKSFETGESFSTNRFLSILMNEDEAGDILDKKNCEEYEKTINVINEITEYWEKDPEVSIVAYFVSNEENPLPEKDIRIMERTFHISVNPVTLDDISSFLAPKKYDIEAKLKIPSDKIMVYRESDDSSNSSYIFSISLYELSRITCKDSSLRKNYNIEWEETDNERKSSIESMELESSLLHDNVRGYLGHTPYNRGIIQTIEGEPSKFFMFNNGVTITADDIYVPTQLGARFKFVTLKNFQIVNGGQTLRSVYEYIAKNIKSTDNIVGSLRDAAVLVRAYNTKEEDNDNSDSTVASQIAQYTNSQNAISPADLRSNDKIQLQIQKYLSVAGYEYVLKRSSSRRTKKNGDTRINMDLMAQILCTNMGAPEMATTQKRKLFIDYYDDIFKSDSFTLEAIPDLLREYRDIEEYYMNLSEGGRQNYRQKYLYVMYIRKEIPNISIENARTLLEESLRGYFPEKNLADSRKMIYPGFKKFVDSNIMLYINGA
jgi:hypothetical protein